MEICFNKRLLDYWDVYRRVSRRICIRGSSIVENGHISIVVEIKIPTTRRAGESTDPYSR